MLKPHINTAYLIMLQDDILKHSFAPSFWQRGPACTLDTSGNFYAANLRLLDTDGSQAHAPSSGTDLSFDFSKVLCISGVGYFQVSSITNNNGAVLRAIPAIQSIINAYSGEEVTESAFSTVTSAEWSFGGWEHKLAMAYQQLLADLYSRDVLPYDFADTEPVYCDAPAYKALELVCLSLATDPNGHFRDLATWYHGKYQSQLENVRGVYSGSDKTRASQEWSRSS